MLLLLALYVSVGAFGELFHTHTVVYSLNNLWYKDDSGCGVTHHHTKYQKDDCLACARAGSPQSFSSSLILRCFNETLFVRLIEHSRHLQSFSSSFDSRGPPEVNS